MSEAAGPRGAGPGERSLAVGPERLFTLTGPDGLPYRSTAPGQLGGHRRSRIYGRLGCPSARRALARGGYRAQRVFFADETTAITAGYRPCAVCLPEDYARWKASRAAPR